MGFILIIHPLSIYTECDDTDETEYSRVLVLCNLHIIIT